jgi:hypothetical protein
MEQSSHDQDNVPIALEESVISIPLHERESNPSALAAYQDLSLSLSA